MIIDGKQIARDILEEVRGRVTAPVTVRAITVAPTPATRSYLRIKEKAAEQAGMTLEVVQLDNEASTEEVIAAVEASGADAIIVQLPLPAQIDESRVLAAIPEGKDPDVLSPHAQGNLLPPVAAAVKEILDRSDIDPNDMKCVVVGEGRLVGAPVAAWLRSTGAHVIVLNKDTFTLPESTQTLQKADIIVSGAGVPRLITPDLVKEGVVLIDAGTSEDSGEIVGDIDPACAPKASIYTPVPGGVGPITVACLFRNCVR